MRDKKTGFGIPSQKPNLYHQHIGKYRLIHMAGHVRTPHGKIISIDQDNVATLSPYQGIENTSSGDSICLVKNDSSTIHLTPGCIIEPSSKENLYNWCTRINKPDSEDLASKIEIISR